MRYLTNQVTICQLTAFVNAEINWYSLLFLLVIATSVFDQFVLVCFQSTHSCHLHLRMQS